MVKDETGTYSDQQSVGHKPWSVAGISGIAHSDIMFPLGGS